MEIHLKVVDNDVELVFSDDVSPERLVKFFAFLQKKVLDDYIKSPKDRKALCITLNKILQGGQTEPTPRKPDDFSVVGTF